MCTPSWYNQIDSERIPSGFSNSCHQWCAPLHVVCQHHDSTTVVDFIISQDPKTLNTVDKGGNTHLHCACLGAKYKTITHLYQSAPVSKRNLQKKIPLEVLMDSNAVCNRYSEEYVDCVFRLSRADPETMMTAAAADQINSLAKTLDEAKI